MLAPGVGAADGTRVRLEGCEPERTLVRGGAAFQTQYAAPKGREYTPGERPGRRENTRPSGPGVSAADGTRSDLPERNHKESSGNVETPDPQKRPESTLEGILETQSVTPVTENRPMTPLQRDALMRAIKSAKEEGRHLDAKALGELFARLGG